MSRPIRSSSGVRESPERERVDDLHPAMWTNPEPAERYPLVVVGAGFAGLTAAQTAAARGIKVALIERDFLGGTCLNTGCVPSKAIIRTSRLYADMRDATRFGAQVPPAIPTDFAATMMRVRSIRAHIGRGISAARLAATGVDLFFGDARFVGKDVVSVDGTNLRFDKAVIASGARPKLPSIPGLADAGYLTNETFFEISELPRRMLVIGGGPIGCEQAQVLCRLGAHTTIVQNKPLFLEGEERDAAQILSTALARDGVKVRLNTEVSNIRVEHAGKQINLVSDDYRNTIEVDAILAGVGRAPNVEELGLESAGVAYDMDNGIRVDDFLRTTNRGIYAAGDVCLDHKYGHTAGVSAEMAVHNALFGKRRRWSQVIIPWVTFTDPEVAHVGLYVREANQRGVPVKTFTVLMHEVHRAVIDSEQAGFVKIHVREGTDRILGATIVARHAGDMINEITLAMVAGIGLRTLAKVIHAYDTQAEAIQKAAKACEWAMAAAAR
ncbi:MAG: mercuric reductase [Xanthomonadaceae bacterium]|nr:mercuric reductase [Xanthomonadaceae bacterium]